jgi:hypothetical protein
MGVVLECAPLSIAHADDTAPLVLEAKIPLGGNEPAAIWIWRPVSRYGLW